ncbi:MAG: DNA adenine methylase [Treponema sp.]|nr:DNA adenine methylase [Treponema sp.]
MRGAFGYDGEGKYTKKLANKRKAFTVEYAIRLQQTQIECCDALRVIKSGDAQDAFFYCDPPYVGAAQCHYAGYMQADFDNLLKVLEAIGGKFLLSSYPNESLRDFARRNGWYTVELSMASTMTNGYSNSKKIEVLTANYPIAVARGDCGGVDG